MSLIKNFIKAQLFKLGYEIRNIRTQTDTIENNGLYEMYQYNSSDGAFDYEKYRDVQIAGNKRKINTVFVKEENVSFLSSVIKNAIGDVKFGLCHGTQRGKEQEWFSKNLDCKVIGTELSDTATDFPNTINWDFHDVKPEWVGSVDFIYSNSLDHSYDPKKAIDAWTSCLKPNGICIIEHTWTDVKSTNLDCFGVHISLLPYLILNWGNGKYCVQKILDAPVTSVPSKYIHFLLIQNT